MYCFVCVCVCVCVCACVCVCTCELLVCLHRVGLLQQGHDLLQPPRLVDRLLVFVVLEGEVPEGRRRRLADLRVLAMQQSHQTRNPFQLQHLPAADRQGLVA